MATLLLVVSIAILLIGGRLADGWDFELVGIFLVIVGVLSLVVFGIFEIDSLYTISSGKVVDQKISMYQSENSEIENQVDTLVKQYMTHENETFDKSDKKDTMTLVSLYPELKSDSLVNEQIKIYNKNNSQIKKLKEEKIDVSVAKWWLYFGK